MKRRPVLLLGALGLSPLALLAWPDLSPALPEPAPSYEAPQVDTASEPVRKRLARLGPIVSTQQFPTDKLPRLNNRPSPLLRHGLRPRGESGVCHQVLKCEKAPRLSREAFSE